MNQQEAKQQIQKLVDKYQRVAKEEKIKSYNEAQTRNEFIEPFFEFLGWDMRNLHNDNEVTTEENIAGDRADLAFRVNGIPVMFLEAKPLKADLNIEQYSRQAINYAWNKGVSYAVLTDFESIKVFNAQAESKSLFDKLIFEIHCADYLKDFDRVWLLAKESFLKGALDEYAQKYGKMKKHLTVNEKLFGDLKKAREILTQAFGQWDKKLDRAELEEGVQKILDRLVFIRVLEDRGLESPILKEALHKWEKNKNEQFFPFLAKKFRELDDIYNSSIFKKHNCEEWEEYGDDTFKKVVNLLYGTEMYTYDFADIPADILGGVYESYLGYIAKEKSGKKESPTKEEKQELKQESRKKRKEQGIFYTPKYIVDYIVKETLGHQLAECDSIQNLKKIKLLDPACGSGSFLIKALEAINDKYKEFGNAGNQYTKSEILLSNIYGVDLDAQAIELAKLNLLIEALDKKAKLPDITPHIREGNSLIAEGEEKYKPFDFQAEFKEVFRQGGFDVIIGNPPYGAEISKDEADIFHKMYDIGSTDTAALFIKKAFEILEKNGKLGFIIPKAFCFASNWEKIREYIWDYVEAIIDCGKAWKEVKLEQVVFIVNKGKKTNSYASGRFEKGNLKILGKISKKDAKEFGFFLNGVSEAELAIAKRIKTNSIMLNDISDNQRGAILQKFISDVGDREAIGGAQVQKFGIVGIKGKVDSKKVKDEQAFIKNNSVLVQNIIAHIENPVDHIKITACVPQNKNYWIVDTVNQITLNNGVNPFAIWCLLNSKLINWYAYRFIFGKAIRTMHFDNAVTDRLPIPKNIKDNQTVLVEFAKKIINLGQELQIISPDTDKYAGLENKINHLEAEMDQKFINFMGLEKKKLKKLKMINLELLKNELSIARTSFEIAKKYKNLAQNLDNKNVDQKAILPFYIFTSFAHLNHCLMSVRKICFDKEAKTALSIVRYFDGELKKEWEISKRTFLGIKRKYSDIQNSINEIIAHIGNNKNKNSIFPISENDFKKVGDLLDEIVELINNFPDSGAEMPPGELSAFINVLSGFDNLISVADRGIESRIRRKK